MWFKVVQEKGASLLPLLASMYCMVWHPLARSSVVEEVMMDDLLGILHVDGILYPRLRVPEFSRVESLPYQKGRKDSGLSF